MKLPKDLAKRYRKVKNQGDGKILKKLLKYKNRATVSGVLSGDKSTTLEKIEKIKSFIENRERIVNALTES